VWDEGRQREDFYKILGVAPDATTEEIKTRYRELVRKYHPDARRGVGSDKEFVRIARAYRVLSDPDRRREYDVQSGRGAGITLGASRTASRSSGDRRARATAAPGFPGTEEILRRAERAFSRGAMHEARALCQRVLSYDRRNGPAHALLGDIFRVQGRVDEAITMYTIAVQLDPRDDRTADNLDRLLKRAKAVDDEIRLGPEQREERERQRQEKRIIGTIAVLTIAFVLPFAVDLTVGNKVVEGFALLSTWTERLAAMMMLEGFIIGVLLSVIGMLRPIDEEFIYDRAYSVLRKSAPPVGLLLVLFGAIFFYMSLTVYVIMGIVQDSFSRSLSVLYGTTLALTLVFALSFSTVGANQVLLWGGNVIFLCMLFGWFVGDLVRPGI
jgi:tetratricopeptide (TPR) repeat protein